MRESVTVADRAERARLARAFVSSVFGPGHPCGEEAVLLVSEMFDYDIRRSQSGTAGETITVAVRTGDGAAGSESLAGAGLGVPWNPSRCRQAVKWWACLGRVYVAGSAVQPRSSGSSGAAGSSAPLSVRGAVACCCRQAPGAMPWWRRKAAANA